MNAQEIRKEDHTLFERGRGNVCSVEVRSSLSYRNTPTHHVHSSTASIAGMRQHLSVRYSPFMNLCLGIDDLTHRRREMGA